jgi:hypothetical protein
MSGARIEVLPQPRVDLLVDGADGSRRRHTEYSGVAWFGGRPQLTGFGSMSMTQGARIESPFFLPDSLPYDGAKLADATLSITIAAVNLSDHLYLFDQQARFAADPAGRPTWVQVQLLLTGRIPLAVSYRVVAQTAVDAVLTV